jgi:hypothetical protein
MRRTEPKPTHPNRTIKFALPWLLCLPLCGASIDRGPAPASPSVDTIVKEMVRAEEARQAELREYSVQRRYVLQNKRLNPNAEMDVRLTYRDGHGKQFDVLSMRRAEGLFKRAFERMLDAEAEASRKRDVQDSRVTPQNYQFAFAGMQTINGRRCYVLQLTPRSKSKYLLDGKVWVDAEDYAIARLEGRPSANVSFWIGKPHITQEFRKVGEHWLPSFNRSLAEPKLVGQTELTIQYSGYEFPTAVAKSHGPAGKSALRTTLR